MSLGSAAKTCVVMAKSLSLPWPQCPDVLNGRSKRPTRPTELDGDGRLGETRPCGHHFWWRKCHTVLLWDSAVQATLSLHLPTPPPRCPNMKFRSKGSGLEHTRTILLPLFSCLPGPLSLSPLLGPHFSLKPKVLLRFDPCETSRAEPSFI